MVSVRDASPHIGVLLIDIHIPAAQSLKDKRMVMRRIKDRAKNKFNVSIAELEGLDKWQVATLGFSMIGNDHIYLNQTLQNILSFVESFHNIEVCEHQIEFI